MKSLLAMLSLLLTATLTGCATGFEESTKEPAVKDVILATTTSTYDTGLLDVLVPDFREKTGYNCMAPFMVSGCFSVIFPDNLGFLFKTHINLIFGILKIYHPELVLVSFCS